MLVPAASAVVPPLAIKSGGFPTFKRQRPMYISTGLWEHGVRSSPKHVRLVFHESYLSGQGLAACRMRKEGFMEGYSSSGMLVAWLLPHSGCLLRVSMTIGSLLLFFLFSFFFFLFIFSFFLFPFSFFLFPSSPFSFVFFCFSFLEYSYRPHLPTGKVLV